MLLWIEYAFCIGIGVYLLIGAMCVDTGAAILAGIRLTLFDILGTGVTGEAGRAVATEAAASR